MDECPKVQFGKILRAQRIRANFSQEDLAARCGLHRTYVSSIERGERNVSLVNIVLLATALGIQPHVFFDGWDSSK